MSNKVLLTDHPWPDVQIERQLLEQAGYELVAGPIETPDAATVEAMVAEHDPLAIMTCWAQVSAAAIERPTKLAIVARIGVGLDNIVIPAVTARGAWVSNVPDYCVEEVSDHSVALLLDLWRGITLFDRDVKSGNWNPAAAKLHRVADMTVAVVGYGRIGAATARKLSRGFGCRVLVTSPTLLRTHALGHEIAPGVFVADIDTMQREADAIVLNTPLTSSNRHMVNDEFIAKLRREPLIVNVSRGGLIDNDALLRGLDARRVRGAGLDVIEGEPSPPTALTRRAEVVATPHIAFSSAAALAEVRRRSTQDVVRALRGEQPLNPCNRPG